eukprot:4756197-Alexandrium_andersonii.AAC.1
MFENSEYLLLHIGLQIWAGFGSFRSTLQTSSKTYWEPLEQPLSSPDSESARTVALTAPLGSSGAQLCGHSWACAVKLRTPEAILHFRKGRRLTRNQG